jgi:hypothetical protein
MAIDSPIVRAFIDDELRPLAEKIRAVELESAAVVSRWFDAGISTLVPNTAEDVVTNRPELPTLTGAQVNSMVAQGVNVSPQFAASVYERFCVRAAEVS